MTRLQFWQAMLENRLPVLRRSLARWRNRVNVPRKRVPPAAVPGSMIGNTSLALKNSECRQRFLFAVMGRLLHPAPAGWARFRFRPARCDILDFDL